MPSRRPDLQNFEDADHHDGNHRREQPVSGVGQSKRQPDQNEREPMLAVLTEVGMRPKAAGPSVAKVTAAANSQAKF